MLQNGIKFQKRLLLSSFFRQKNRALWLSMGIFKGNCYIVVAVWIGFNPLTDDLKPDYMTWTAFLSEYTENQSNKNSGLLIQQDDTGNICFVAVPSEGR